MIEIDGAEGEGGGQVLRNACAMALITGESFHITRIRDGREKPGLMRQHVTAIEAACAIGSAECEGLAIGASEITFRPGRVVPGNYRFAIGTAGSCSLVLQAVLPPLLLSGGPSSLVLEGGTHNMAAPPFDFLAGSFLPLLNRMGPRVTARLVRHGFYPKGGGRIEVEIAPAPLQKLELMERGAPLHRQATALIAGIPFEVAKRELATARQILGWPEESFATRQLPEAEGPGNALLLEAGFEQVTEIMTGFGQRGTTAEMVAKTAANRLAGYLESDAFAGPYLADQLLLPMALAGGGRFTTVKPSQHTLTAAALIQRFLGRRVLIEKTTTGVHEVEVG